jgi:hypothetical protein
MQGIKESSTLRVGPKGGKPSPKVANRWGKQDGQVELYFENRREINKIEKNLSLIQYFNARARSLKV